jgi:methyl coenzyme M reductase beta subunit
VSAALRNAGKFKAGDVVRLTEEYRNLIPFHRDLIGRNLVVESVKAVAHKGTTGQWVRVAEIPHEVDAHWFDLVDRPEVTA